MTEGSWGPDPDLHYAGRAVSSVRSWSSRGPLILAAAVSAVLLGTVLLTTRTVAVARDGAARGIGNGFVVAGRESLRRPARLDPAALAAFLEDQRAEGLRYVAVIAHDGRVLAEAGEPRLSAITPGLHQQGDRARLVDPTPGRRPRATPRAMVYEFEPRIASQLRDDARLLWIVAAAASAAVFVLALGLRRGLQARERMQAELERGRRLAALGEMSAVLSHELRNPLASLKGHAQLLVEVLPESGPARGKAERVVAESVRLEALANDLLDFVRSGELAPAPVAPAELVRAAAAEVDAARIELDTAGAPARWSLDASRLRQALVNILRNAVQASPEGAAVTARVGLDAGRLVITVRDRGAGIPPGDEAKIFEPFHTRRVKGVGLGLAIARRIVEQHGGTIAASNHDGGGAVFRMTLPEAG